MPTVLQFRRGTTTQNGNFTGTLGEVSINTTTDAIRVHDGSTAGGFEMLRNDMSNGADSMAVTSATASKPEVKLTNTRDDATSPILVFESDRANPADNDVAGEISFISSDSGGTQTEFAQIQALAADVTNTTEDGKLTFTTLANGSAVVPLTLDASGATIVGNVAITDGGTIGTATDADAVTIAAAGAVTFSQRSVHSSGITIDTGGSRTSSGQTENIIITNSNLTGDDTGIHMTAGNTGNSTIRFGAPSDDTLASILVTNATTSATLKLAAGNGNTNLTLSGTAGSESAVFAGTVKRDGTAAFLVIESGGTDGAGTDAGDNIIIEAGGTDGAGANASDDILLEDQIFHHTGHSSVSLTIFDSGGAVVKSLIGVHQDTSELN